jgi:hypothetical protein
MAAISTVQLQKINLEIEQAWADSQAMIDNGALDVATLDTLVANQSGMLAPAVAVVTDPSKDYDLEVYWPDFCGQEATDCSTDPCTDFNFNQAEVQKKAYKIEQCIEDRFSVSEEDFWKSWLNKDGFIAKNINQKITNLLNRLNYKALVFLHANAGLNKGGQFTANGSGQYEVSGSLFGSTNVIIKMLYDAQVSRVPNPFILDGKNLWETVLNARLNQPNGEGKGDANRANLFGNVTFDPLGFSKLADVANSTFLVSPAAYHFAHKNYIQDAVPVYDEASEAWKYSIELGRYGVRVDVFMKRVCENATKNLYKYNWLFKLHFDFFANPFGCADGNGDKVTGIIEYTNTDYGGQVIGG